MRLLAPLAILLLLTSCMTAPNPQKMAEANEVILKQEGIIALKVGDKAPAFTATSATGQRVVVGVGTASQAKPEAVATKVAAAPKAEDAPTADPPAAPSSSDKAKPEASPATDTPAASASDADQLYTVLFFYPADFTPNSARNLRELSKDIDQFAAVKVQILAISTGSAEDHKRFAEQYGITVPLLVDTGAIAASYGCAPPGSGADVYPQRTLVGIKPDGTIGFYERVVPHTKLVESILKLCGREPAPGK